MFKLTHPLPKKYWIAVSGGIDSAAVLHWLNKPSRKNSLLGVVNINHGTEYGKHVDWLLDEYYIRQLGLNVIKFRIEGKPPKGESKECWWRDRRYEFFNQVPGNGDIILAHHMDDCLEEYIMNTMVRGYADTIKYRNGRCVRPFRLWKKKSIVSYIMRQKPMVPRFEDESNKDIKFKRNYIRHKIVPEVLAINPGVYNIVARLIKSQG